MKSKYYLNLPKLIKISHKCQALDKNGQRCNKIAKIESYYHGDGEIYSQLNDNDVNWVTVYLCIKCTEMVCGAKLDLKEIGAF